jgi:putative DNA-invertase from lambdoid prophage Rac
VLYMSRVFAYCRVSTFSQHTDNQVQEIKDSALKVDKTRIVTETVSGSVAALERPEFIKLLAKLEPLDVLVVTKIDRLGRNAMDVRATVEMLADMGKPATKAGEKAPDPLTYGVRVHCLALGSMDLTSPAGKMTMGVIASVAEFERDLLIERTLSGQARARASGTHMGRPAKTSTTDRAAILSALAKGATVSSQADKYKISRASIISIRTKAESTATA